MKISLPSLLDKIETQRKRIEDKFPTGKALKTDIQIVELNGTVLAPYTEKEDDPDIERYCICVLPRGTFLDPERTKLRKGGFLLPCVDAMAPTVFVDPYKEPDRPIAREEEKSPVAKVKAPKREWQGVSKDELDAARAEAAALQEKRYAADRAYREQGRRIEEAREENYFEAKLGTLFGQAWHNGKRLA